MARGPSYPYVGLEDALGFSRKMYDYTKRGSASVDSVVADAWKYSPTSSSGQKILAALKAFGLVEDSPGSSGKSVRLTPRAIRILLDDQDSAERRDEIRRAATSPKAYDYCWRTWGKEMPPSMRSTLLIDQGFVDTTVDAFLKEYRKTVAFAGLLDEKLFGESEESETESKFGLSLGDYVQWESLGMLRLPEAKRLIRFSEDGNYGFVEGSNTGVPIEELVLSHKPESASAEVPTQAAQTPVVATQKGVNKMQTETFALPDGVVGQLQWPLNMTQEAYEDFVYQLEGLRRRVSRAVAKERTATPEVASEG